MSKPTRFICFYSYKGGVGRSLALANAAYLLALQGSKVLIMDMDLEAPGQHMTELFYEEQPISRPGLLELLEDYQQHVDEGGKDFSLDIRRYVRRSSVFDRDISEAAIQNERLPDDLAAAGSIDLLPAVSGVDKAFQRKLAYWDWKKFYENYDGEAFFGGLKTAMRQAGYDYVLIDSRTGMSDVFFISTLALADTVVLVSSFNRQNIEGSRLAAETLLAEHNIEAYGRKRLLCLLSPLPLAPPADIDRRMGKIRQEWPEIKQPYFILPYMPEMALEETLLARYDSRRRTGIKTQYTKSIQELLSILDKDTETNASIMASEETNPGCINPFPAIRVEYWKEKDVVDYFVDPGGNIHYAMQQFMPTLLFGSRGTGKTILARWRSYETLVYRLVQLGHKPTPNTAKEPIGLWFRLDVDLLNVFNTKEKSLRDNFDRLFGQFFDLLVLRKALDALERLGGIGAWCDAKALFRVLGREMGLSGIPINWNEFAEDLEQRLAEIRAYINNPDRTSLPYLVQDNVLMKLLAEQLLHDGKFRSEHFFIVFVDEYENFRDYQQRIVNTRLKQVKESDRVTYKLLVRNDGMHTYETLAKDQPIEVTHDFRSYNLDEGVEFQDFKQHIGLIVNKHLQASRYFKDRGCNDAAVLLAEQSPEDEAWLMAGKRGAKPLRQWLEKQHADKNLSSLLAWMDKETSLLRQAVAVVMLNQGKLLEAVVAEFSADSQLAKDWYHNYHRGALHWLGNLYKKGKTYASVNDLVGVAGNNTRVALDLCYAIVEQWLARDEARCLPIAVDIQNQAIHAQSEVYFRKLRDRREEAGEDFYQFVERLGRLFQIIHKGPRQGEPEINHFFIEGEPDADTERMLKRCRNDAVLRWLPGNKQKGKADEHRDAWQLHPRYAPFFDISWRRKKMLKLTAGELHALFFGNQSEWKQVVNRVERQYCTPNAALAAQQGSLFDADAD